MELIKKTTLHFQEGTSDKIYEASLYKTEGDLYLVKGAYGRRGANLKEDNKTKNPVTLTEAEKIFTQLVNSKVKKGYQEITSPDAAPEKTTSKFASREEAILDRLTRGVEKKWPLERAIWRAGELKIRAATPRLLELLGTGEKLRDYCLIWALGWCGDASAIPRLTSLSKDRSQPEFIRRIAWDALYKLADETTRLTMVSEKIEELPLQLRDLAKQGTSSDFLVAIKNYLNTTDYKGFAVLDTLYQIDNAQTRPALLNILAHAPFAPNYFKQIRHIFKMAEYRHDAQVFAQIGYRLAKEPAMYKGNTYYISLTQGGYVSRYDYKYNQQTRRHERTENPDFLSYIYGKEAKVAYSDNTKEYLQKRVWRTLKQLGEENDSDYIKMATEILLHYSDTDAETPKKSVFSRWIRQNNNWTRIDHVRQWDSYARYLIFNHILYENSPRYFLKSQTIFWQCRDEYKLGQIEPEIREEAFPSLWQKHPQGLLRLLLESNCRPVHHFAAKALRDCPEFCNGLDKNVILRLLNKTYEVTVQLGFDLIKKLYNPQQPDWELLQILANCPYQPARIQSYQWIEATGNQCLLDYDFISSLIFSPYPDTNAFICSFLKSFSLDESTIKIIIGRIIADLLNPEKKYQPEIVREINNLFTSFTVQLKNIGFNVILDLLAHPMAEIQTLGAYILLNHSTEAVDLPPELIQSLINSPHESVRLIGMDIFAKLPDATLLQSYNLIVAMASHELTDIRNSIRVVIKRLASNYSSFQEEITVELIQVLLRKEKQEGIHKSIVAIIKEDLPDAVNNLTKDNALKLANSQYPLAQELGGYVLLANRENWSSEFATPEIVKLANNEILLLRQAAWGIFERNIDRFRSNSQEMLAAVRLLESKWDDSREFAWRIFQQEFTNQHWTAEIMISICDSIRDDVRQFGRDLVTRYFQADNGQEYLLKFSEHPSGDIQLFATNYLEAYAIDNPQRLRELKPYFIAVLSSVNKGRIAKNRVMAFLEKEAEKNETSAFIVGEILTRQSLTIAIGDKAKAIQAMVKIKQKYPQISLPISIKSIVEVRS